MGSPATLHTSNWDVAAAVFLPAASAAAWGGRAVWEWSVRDAKSRVAAPASPDESTVTAIPTVSGPPERHHRLLTRSSSP